MKALRFIGRRRFSYIDACLAFPTITGTLSGVVPWWVGVPLFLGITCLSVWAERQ